MRWSLFCALLAAVPLRAQQTLPSAPTPEAAEMFGDVIDSHDGLVPGATIHATLSGGLKPGSPAPVPPVTRDLTSDSAGHFLLRNLPPGMWTLVVTAPGLSTYEAPHILLKPGDRHEVQGVVLAIAEQHADVTVTMTTEQVAAQEIHDQEKQRALGIFPNFNTSYVWNAAPMNSKQKFGLALRATLDPVAFGTAAAVAGAEQINGTYPDYGSGPSGYGLRYGAAFGNQFIGHMLGYAVFPSIFRQDTRYFYMGTGTKKQRAIHAIASSVLARGNNGHTQIAASHILGNFAAGYISRAYHPDTTNTIGLAVDNTLIGVAGQAGVNLFREFIIRRISKGTPEFGKGKPAGENTPAWHP